VDFVKHFKPSRLSNGCIFILLLLSMGGKEVPPDMMNLSRFDEDRILLHSMHLLRDGKRILNTDPRKDSSLATLVVIRNSQTYIFRDGHDDPGEVSRLISNYKKNLTMYRTRQSFLKEFREIQEEKIRWDAKPPEFRAPTDPSEKLYDSLFLKFDPVYRQIHSEMKKAEGEEYRTSRFRGRNSPELDSLREQKNTLRKEAEERKNFLIEFLSREDSQNTLENKEPGKELPRSQTPLPPAPDPGNWSENNFFRRELDGNWDYASYSRSPRTIDWEIRDRDNETKVQERYGKLADTIVERLLAKHAEKMRYLYFRRGEFGARSSLEMVGLEGKRLILQTSDQIRYVLEDLDGDGKAENWEISNTGIAFRHSKEAANIVSIQRCQIEKFCRHFENLLNELESGSFVSLGDIQQYGKGGNQILGNEDELLRDWESLIREATR